MENVIEQENTSEVSLQDQLLQTNTDIDAPVEGEVSTNHPTQDEESVVGVAEELELDWTKDARYLKEWKSDPNMMYKALKGYDKSHTPLKMALKKYGINDHIQLEDALEQYKGLEGKYSELEYSSKEAVEVSNYLNYLLNDPRYAAKLDPVLKELEREVKLDAVRKAVGDPSIGNIPDSLLNTINELQEQNQLREQERQEVIKQQYIEKNHKQIDSQIEEIQEIAKNNGLTFSEEEEVKFLEWFSSQKDESGNPKYPLEMLSTLYIREAFNHGLLTKNAERKAEERYKKNMEANRKGAIVSSTPSAPSQQKMSVKEAMMQLARKTLGREE